VQYETGGGKNFISFGPLEPTYLGLNTRPLAPPPVSPSKVPRRKVGTGRGFKNVTMKSEIPGSKKTQFPRRGARLKQAGVEQEIRKKPRLHKATSTSNIRFEHN